MHTLGNISLLDREKTAFLCSRMLQSAGILPSLDWATSLNPQSDCVIGGFQSDLERDVLRFFAAQKNTCNHSACTPYVLHIAR